MSDNRTGIIGGSGLYHIEGMKNIKYVKIDTPFGEPSDEFITGELEKRKVVFLARHGRNHNILPGELNFCANIYAMKKLGVDRIISVSACGSLKKEYAPRDIVIPDQFVDRTNQGRRTTFFGGGIVAHIQFAHPVCSELSKELYESGKRVKANVHLGGTYVNMEGPQFSTKAESNLYRQWGMDVIGMTNLGEARVAREAEICYASLACVTDYDCWYEEESVSVEMILANLKNNIETSKAILKDVLPRLPSDRKCICADALKNSILTRPESITPQIKKKLDVIIGKYIK